MMKRVPHAYTTPSSPDSARCWVPCVDNLWEKCTWEFEFVVPKTLEDTSGSMDVEGDDQNGTPTIVVCSGELVEKVIHPGALDLATQMLEDLDEMQEQLRKQHSRIKELRISKSNNPGEFCCSLDRRI